MAQPPILTLTDIALTFGGDPVFSGVSAAIGPGDRLCVVGRNGSGKSTLMKIAAGVIQPDTGERFVKPGASVAYLPQDPDFGGFATLGAYVAEPLAPEEAWRAEMAMEGLKVLADADPAAASGGERRRAALARLLAQEPDLMLLDEPTNHLDIEAIAWLEARLRDTRAGYAIISHDRALLGALTRATLWIDRGQVRRVDRGFATFEAWRDEHFAQEDAARKKLDKLIAEETRWAAEGISARRTRNQGRLRRLQGLRQERRDQIGRAGPAAMALDSGGVAGKRVIEAKGLTKRFEGRAIAADFSLRVARGDRVAFVGPNGVGKTTLIRMLTGALEPDAGTVTIGTNVQAAIFDQSRAALDPGASLWETLTGDADLGVSGRNDQIMVRGRPKHVVGYLKEFLFDDRQARGPVRALSGGEKARLLLAKLMARESNLLVLDEPTNDLDVETLDLLQDVLGDYDGTVLLVSHDRDFLDRVATSVVAWEGPGRWVEYAGGWTDHLTQKAAAPAEIAAPRKKAAAPATPAPKPAPAPPAGKLSFNEQRRLDALPSEIERLEFEIGRLEAFLSDPELYARNPAAVDKAGAELQARRTALAEAEDAWLTLEARLEAG